MLSNSSNNKNNNKNPIDSILIENESQSQQKMGEGILNRPEVSTLSHTHSSLHYHSYNHNDVLSNSLLDSLSYSLYNTIDSNTKYTKIKSFDYRINERVFVWLAAGHTLAQFQPFTEKLRQKPITQLIRDVVVSDVFFVWFLLFVFSVL